MRKILLASAIIASSISFGQKVGIKIGANISNFSQGDSYEIKARVGYSVGGFVRIPITSSISIQPEVVYNNVGAKSVLDIPKYLPSGIEFPEIENKITLDYISVPLMAQFHIVPSLLYVEAGPEFSYLIKTEISGGIIAEIRNTANNLVSYYKENQGKLGFGVAVGAGVSIGPKFGINARYTSGMTDFSKESSYNLKSNIFQIGVLLNF